MRNLIKSALSFSWSMSLFGMRQMINLLSPGERGAPQDNAASAFDAVTRAAAGQMSEPIASVFREGDRLQREVVDQIFGASPGAPGPAQPPAPGAGPGPIGPVDSGRLSTADFVVLGEGLSAGMADFGLKEDLQRESFPAQMARQMGITLRL